MNNYNLLKDFEEELRKQPIPDNFQETFQEDSKKTVHRTAEEREEECYLRGYHQGFYAAKHTQVTENEVKEWRYGDENIAPPGSPFSKSEG